MTTEQTSTTTFSIGDIVKAVAALLAIVGSFLHLYSVDVGFGRFADTVGINAWNRANWGTLVPGYLAVVAACGLSLAGKFAPSLGSTQILGLKVSSLTRILAWTGATVLAFTWLGHVGTDSGLGLWLALAGALLALVVIAFGDKIPALDRAIGGAGSGAGTAPSGTAASGAPGAGSAGGPVGGTAGTPFAPPPAADPKWVAVGSDLTVTGPQGTTTLTPGTWYQVIGTTPMGATTVTVDGKAYDIPAGTPLHKQ